jgi:hypothetical protein
MRHQRSPRLAPAAVLAACAAALALLPVPAQAASGSVHISKIYYDSPGKDTRTNSSLNAEYVQIRNTTAKAVSLKGWTLVDASSHKYVFGSFTLGKGKTVTVRTGTGKDTSSTLYQDRRAYVWNNDKDTATLKKASGSQADTCSYNSAKADVKVC